MNITKLKILSKQLSQLEIGLLKYLTSFSCLRGLSTQKRPTNVNSFPHFTDNHPESFQEPLRNLIKHQLVSMDKGDLIITELGLALGGFNGADHKVINSTDLLEWYEHQKI